VPTLKSYDHKCHLSWGDVAIDCAKNPQTLKVHLKKLKTDQLGKGVDVYRPPIVPVNCHHTLHITTRHRPRFIFKDTLPLTKPTFTNKVKQALQAIGLPQEATVSELEQPLLPPKPE